ncbi:hypothetical protein [Microvirga pudoricolor]|uniref:hypothetical protein n=1 Tax=Microvirga pudoricolor TaxID=2778729 RepID=UPI00195122E7|nr:hypothetical protein [Microvirga pudoricolor]MBM6595554.1 hypothetical protein [Microvirga pudoricolor]
MKSQAAEQQSLTMEERLEKALGVLAFVVAEHGDKHLPLFQMIEGQLTDIRVRRKAQARRRDLAKAIGQLAQA